MNNQPTCKVVKGLAPHPNLARIHPKGCKIRNVLEQGVEQDVIRTYNKAGDRKIKKKTSARDYSLLLARPLVAQEWHTFLEAYKIAYKAPHNDGPIRTRTARHRVVYDTGAMVTQLDHYNLTQLGVDINRVNGVRIVGIRGVGTGPNNPATPTKKYLNVTFSLLLDEPSNTWVTITDDVVDAGERGMDLLGVTSMKKIGSRFKIQFKDAIQPRADLTYQYI